MARAFPESSNSLPSMALALAGIDFTILSDFKITSLGLRSDGQTLLAPFYKGNKIVLDLTPDADDWLEVLDVNSAAMEHHSGEAVQALHLAVRLDGPSSTSVPSLDKFDKLVQTHMGYSLRSTHKTWYPTHRGNGKIVLNIAVQNTATPTVLRFFQNGKFEKGHGMEFLQARLAGGSFKDYRCKAKVELECIQENAEGFTVLITAHSMAFFPMPKRAVVDYTDEEEKAMIQAAKRLKYSF